jgi:hypothetical protein
MGRQVFGCDICQDVCPWNRKAPVSADPELEARAELVNPALEWLAAMDEAEFEREFNGSPVRRAGFWGCGAMWPLPWATAGWAGLRRGWNNGRGRGRGAAHGGALGANRLQVQVVPLAQGRHGAGALPAGQRGAYLRLQRGGQRDPLVHPLHCAALHAVPVGLSLGR